MADRSHFGWDVVNEYKADELAADSDDKSLKAKNAAEQSCQKKRVSASIKRMAGSSVRMMSQPLKSEDSSKYPFNVPCLYENVEPPGECNTETEKGLFGDVFFVEKYWEYSGSDDVASVKEVLCSEVWQVIGSFQDPELSWLAKALPETVLKARAESTTSKYLGAFRWGIKVASKIEITAFPIEVAPFALFLQHLRETTRSRAAVEEAVNAVS
uniref:Uncharacterized protein n=1 Tax=Amphimedon queenslandica TaxID=400682 RepID=A0A1X7U365_AMPQE